VFGEEPGHAGGSLQRSRISYLYLRGAAYRQGRTGKGEQERTKDGREEISSLLPPVTESATVCSIPAVPAFRLQIGQA